MICKTDPPPALSRRDALELCAGGLMSIAGGLRAVPANADNAEQSVDAYVVQVLRDRFSAQSQSLRLLLPNGSGANLGPVIATFTAQTGVNIEPIEVPLDEVVNTLILDNVLDQRLFDIALPATFALPDLVSAGTLLPLDEYVAAHEPAGFRDGILYPTGDTFDGETYGFQTDGDAYLMFYHAEMISSTENQERFAERFGHRLEIPRTWEELDRQMAFFHAPEDGVFGGLLFRVPQFLAWEWWGRFHSKGVWPMAPDLTPQIHGEAGVTALEEMIRATDSLAPGHENIGLFENWERYAKGDIYANIGWGGTQKYLNQPKSGMRGRMVFGPTPGGQIGQGPLAVPYFNWGWNFVVSATSDYPELAYLFSLFAASPRMSTLAVGQTGGFFDPFRAEHYQDAKIIDAYSAPFLKVHREAMGNAIPDLYLKGHSEYFSALAKGLDAAVTGALKPEVALQGVAQKWELISGKAGHAQQVLRWRDLREKYPPHVKAALRDL
jgi:multiple sugar transport system substrate-binding protein